MFNCSVLFLILYITLNILLNFTINIIGGIIIDDETLKVFAYISISSYRTKALKSLENDDKTPTQIAKDSNIRMSHISNILKELKDCGVAECINEQERKNRIYRLTPMGRDIANKLD